MRPRHPTARVLAMRPVRLFIGARFFTGFARAVLAATLAYHVYALTGSYAALGFLGLASFVPIVPVALLGGVLADRFDRRGVIVWAHLLAIATAAGLALVAGPLDGRLGPLLAGALGLGVAAALANPAGSAILPLLVPREIFQNAAVVSSSAVQLARAAGPIAMGLSVGPFGIGAPYALAAVSFAVAVGCLLALPRLEHDPSRVDVSLGAVRDGIRFVWRRQAIIGSMALELLAVVFASATALLPVYAEDILRVGPEGYGLLRGALSAGTFLMTLVLLLLRPFRHPGRALLRAVLVYGLATIAFGLSRSFPLSLVTLLVVGMADQVSKTTRSVILQLSTPDQIRGRVSSVNLIFVGASNELGDAESGFLAWLTNATFSVVAGGVASLLALAAVAAAMPELRRYRPRIAADAGVGTPEKRGT